ncbi:MAG TPA: hypothetical protein VMS00_03790 [Acidimicrobiales bacterium]|nr:hypothetical protein [Acidimicrobiales bacterium]
MTGDEAVAAARLVLAAEHAALHIGKARTAGPLREALAMRPGTAPVARLVALVWAVQGILSNDRRTSAPWFRELDDAFETLFVACTSPVGPTIRSGGSYDGRNRGRPPKRDVADAA